MNQLLSSFPTWALDLSGGLTVLVSLYFLFAKRRAYWHWSNTSARTRRSPRSTFWKSPMGNGRWRTRRPARGRLTASCSATPTPPP